MDGVGCPGRARQRVCLGGLRSGHAEHFVAEGGREPPGPALDATAGWIRRICQWWNSGGARKGRWRRGRDWRRPDPALPGCSPASPGILQWLLLKRRFGSCRRGTWLDVQANEPQTGLSVAELEQAVLGCLEERQREQRVRVRGVAALHDAPEQRRGRLPGASGALIAGLGMAVGVVAFKQVPNPGPLLTYAALPPVLGGLVGYAVPRRWRDALWLSGYWVGVAGTTLVAGLHGDGAKPVLIGGLLTAGAMGSAGLSLFHAASFESEGSLPASVGIPAAVGSGLAMLGLLVRSRGSSSLELATVGALAAVAPAVWLQIAPSGGAEDRAPLVGVDLRVHEHGAVLGVTGDL